mgnify:CR=1 FL=1
MGNYLKKALFVFLLIVLCFWIITLFIPQEALSPDSVDREKKETLSKIKKKTLFSGKNSSSWLGRPLLLEKEGFWILVYRKANQHTFSHDSRLHIRFSKNQGDSWTDEDVYIDGSPVSGFPIKGHSDFEVAGGCLAKAPNEDLILLVREERGVNGTYVWRSKDGGMSWADEGQINGDNTLLMGGQVVVVGEDLYASFWADPDADFSPPYKTVLYKSRDNGLSWKHLSDIASGGTDESALAYLGEKEILAVLRDTDSAETYFRKSKDLGQSWGPLEVATDSLGVLQRPKLRVFPNEPERVYLFGRDSLPGNQNKTVVYYSDDGGFSWSFKFYPEENSYLDAGYCDMLRRTNGVFYMLSYAGTSFETDIKEYLFKRTGVEN